MSDKQNTERIQDKLRDHKLLSKWWGQYAIDAADKIDELEQKVRAENVRATKAEHLWFEHSSGREVALIELAAVKAERDNLRGSYDHVRDVLVKALGMRPHEYRPLEYYARLIVDRKGSVEAERDALRKDALRWRHERTGYRFPGTYDDREITCLADLEEAIDAAMQETKP